MGLAEYEKSALDALQEVCQSSEVEPYQRVQAAEEILKHVRGGEAIVVMKDPVPVRPTQRAGG